jgi:S1-C subfamily serine protease
MKKGLLVLLALPLIGFGQDLENRLWYNQENVFTNEDEIIHYLDNNKTYHIEGIYEFKSKGFGPLLNEGRHRLALINCNESFYFIKINAKTKRVDSNPVKGGLKYSSTENLFMLYWFKNGYAIHLPVGYKYTSPATYFHPFLSFELPVGPAASPKEEIMEKVYPKEEIKPSAPSKKKSNNEWAGNGSGIIISKSGHIITNHHVIEDAEDIEVEFILNDEVQKFSAEIIHSDKVNDLSVIKIVDVNFDGVKELPYNFQTISSDVGTKVYAYGYPMALSIMGKEIKVTDGIISSKTGFDGDITSYQISAPIQAGNSGGPLFDDK